MGLVPVLWYFGFPLTILYDNYGPMISVVIVSSASDIKILTFV